jgi:FkbM family methyltransferase
MSDSLLLQSNTNLFGRLRALGRRLPVLKRVFLPLWNPFTHVCWQVRNALTLRRPLRIAAGQQQILMHPAGQIAEALWVSNFEAAERALVARVTRPGMRVVNIGANAGLYTLMTAKLTGQSGEVHAFEPSTATYGRLESNVALNALSNVRTHRLALSDAPGRLVLRSDPRNQSLDGHRFVESLSGSAAVGAGDEVIECDTLDRYFARQSQSGRPPPIDLLIMDVEGAEWSVLRGAQAVLRSSPNLLMILECSHNRAEVEEFLAGQQFSFYVWNAESAALESTGFVAAASIGTVLAYRGDPSACVS